MKDHEKDRTAHRQERDSEYKHNMHGTNLVRLKDADDLKVAKHDTDVRGWPVLTADNLEIGKVDELVVDTNAMKVRYMVVDLYNDYAADKIDHYLLLPIGAARLHEKNNQVLASGIKSTTVLNYPVYRGTAINREYEHSVRNFFERGGTAPTSTAAGIGGATGTAMAGRTIIQTDEDHIYGHATDREPLRASDTDIHGSTYRHDIESSHMEDPSRMDDTTRSDTDSMSGGNRLRGERREPITGDKPLGTPNFSTPADFNERTQTSGLTPRTGSLENKEINEGPSGTTKAEWDAQRPHRQEGEWNDTSNLNSSTSLSNDPKRGSNLGNVENRPQYHTDRERAASPEHTTRSETPGNASTDDQFYDHDHFDEEVFYVRRRRREE